MIDLDPHEREVLYRLTDDAELMFVLGKIDEYRAEILARQLIDETQSQHPESAVMIQYGSQISERMKGSKFYRQVAIDLRKKQSA